MAHAIWWQVYPLGFVGAPVSSEAQRHDPSVHSLERLIVWLDYAVELGVSGLLLGPIFASETHGYDTTDFCRIDPRLGDSPDVFDRLVTEAHARGLRVVLDGVFNHVGRSFAPFQRALEEGRSAPEFGWFRAIGEAADPGEQRFENFEGHDALVLLDHDEPRVADFVAGVMSYWLDRGADGWRLDAAYAVPPAFWATVLPRVRNGHPEAFLFGEVIHGDYPAIVAESTLDSVTQYELWKAVWSSISDANFFELSAALDRHDSFVQHFVPVTFVGNHDVTRLASTIGDERHREHALVVLMTVAGTPTLYYGDEQGFTGVKEERAGGDDVVRPEFGKGGPSTLAPEGWTVYHLHQSLIGLRRRHVWLHSARTTGLALTNEFFAYEVAAREGVGRLVVLLNLADSEYRQALDGRWAVVAGAAAQSGTTVTVPPHGWAVLQPA
ncbi:alpha-amylase [Subtercola boreus]|uniref:Alpha-amylase n=1 Tax=Subtercola boreus TaxID=120213 RepID=A0A3E0W9E8_9MICO|nr:alpha-amylase [Subtercola boreus]RFA19142.1 alpha-amylase [Subtercola boreus]RFA25604.1 alpha-amylase [Subtercola boreus]